MYRIPSLQDDKKNLIVKENYFYLELFSLKSSKEFLNFSFFHQFFVPQEFDLLTPGRDTYIHNAVYRDMFSPPRTQTGVIWC